MSYTMNLIWNVILSAVILVESALCMPFTSLIFRIDNEASVFETGDGMYTVIWSTTLPGTGYVTYTYGGEEYTVKDTENASVRSEDSVHSVRIPKEHLDGNTYTVHSQHVATRRAYVALKGRTVSSGPTRFRGYTGQEEINVLMLSDIHENPYAAQKAVDNFDTPADIIVMNGDAVSMMTTEQKFKQVLSYAHRFSGGEIPVIYIRGNHENRGEYGSEAVNIFKTTTGGLYYTCSYGPLSFICLDSGEDKKDSDWSYSGLVDYTSYIAEETKWLESLTPDEDAEYTVCFSHIPNIDNRYGNNWVEPLDNLGVDLLVGAHKHRINFEYRKDTAPFYQMLDGGKVNDTTYAATMLTFGGGQVHCVCYDSDNNLRGEHTYDFT